MGIFKRIKAIAKADINRWLDELEDPIAMLNEYSREMELELLRAHKALSRQILVESKHMTVIVETKNIIEKRSRQAKLAVAQGNEEIARLAVQEKLKLQEQLDLYEQQRILNQGQTQMLKEKIVELQDVYQEMQRRKLMLASRANVALSMKRIQKATDSLQTENLVRGISKTEERILLMEAEAQVTHQLKNPLFHQDIKTLNYIHEEEIDNEIKKIKNEDQIDNHQTS